MSISIREVYFIPVDRSNIGALVGVGNYCQQHSLRRCIQYSGSSTTMLKLKFVNFQIFLSNSLFRFCFVCFVFLRQVLRKRNSVCNGKRLQNGNKRPLPPKVDDSDGKSDRTLSSTGTDEGSSAEGRRRGTYRTHKPRRLRCNFHKRKRFTDTTVGEIVVVQENRPHRHHPMEYMSRHSTRRRVKTRLTPRVKNQRKVNKGEKVKQDLGVRTGGGPLPLG